MGHRLPSAGIPTELSEHFQFYQVIPMQQIPCKIKLKHGFQCTLRPHYLVQSQSMYEQSRPQIYNDQHCRPSHPVKSECYIAPNVAPAERCHHHHHERRNAHQCTYTCCCHCRCKHNNHVSHQRRYCPDPPTDHWRPPNKPRCGCRHKPVEPRCEPRFECRCMEIETEIPPLEATSFFAVDRESCHDRSEDRKMERRMKKLNKQIQEFDDALKLLEIKDMEVDPVCLADPYQSRCCFKLNYPSGPACTPAHVKKLRCAPQFGRKKGIFKHLGF